MEFSHYEMVPGNEIPHIIALYAPKKKEEEE